MRTRTLAPSYLPTGVLAGIVSYSARAGKLVFVWARRFSPAAATAQASATAVLLTVRIISEEQSFTSPGMRAIYNLRRI